MSDFRPNAQHSLISRSTRREMLRRGGMGFGALALASLTGNRATADLQLCHRAPRAKHVIHVTPNLESIRMYSTRGSFEHPAFLFLLP